ncbi:SPFH domain-containing protein [Haliangium ochraceum]|uniref:Band 7 protein n=1 Tax=Haliangium ochraceum (strain DSM 14365 / JCM 11303 / SMP-2) TaxID=502025 RepID=D0LL31_HALO1|nr:SPFH domain-containing protein [Haliangium ochraceum]ACY16751.1 band 7 protein [Haliangium ochraceum DSM 14365]
MNQIARLCMVFVLVVVALWIVPSLLLTTIEPGTVGVRQSALSGVSDEDLEPGWRMRIPGVHKVIVLPAHYIILEYVADEGGQSLQIRTKDNNIVELDVSVPVRIRPGEAHALVESGNHMVDTDGRERFQRLAQETTVSVLREHLADLDSPGFYTTERRLEAAANSLEALNEALAELHLEAETVLIRAITFRSEYENQLQQIQLNEQNKLLDQASERVAEQQQQLDNYVQGTRALSAAREQDWIKRQADLERAYQVGFLDIEADNNGVGAARRVLDELSEEERAAVRARATDVLALEGEALTDAYLLGIKNIEAETREYSKRIQAESDAISARLAAEGAAKLAEVRGAFEQRINALLSSPSGRAYVAWKSAAYVTFDKELVFSSRDGVPALLRLRDFAQQFMGR